MLIEHTKSFSGETVESISIEINAWLKRHSEKRFGITGRLSFQHLKGGYDSSHGVILFFSIGILELKKLEKEDAEEEKKHKS